MDRVNPYAFFDCLAIGVRLQRLLNNVASGEVHLFSYLGCLLSLYRGCPAADWGYTFAGTKDGSPFSADVEAAKETVMVHGYSEPEAGFIRITEDGVAEYETLRELRQNRKRDEFLEGACSSILVLPVGIVKAAVTSDRDMRTAAQLAAARPLLSRQAIDALHDDFGRLREAIGRDLEDLMIPAVIWVSYVSRYEVECVQGPQETGA